MINTNTYGLRQPTYRKAVEPPIKKKRGFLRAFIFLLFLAVLLVASFLTYRHFETKHVVGSPDFRSAMLGYCLDDTLDKKNPANGIESWKCNGTNAQDWTVSGANIVRDGLYCLAVANNGKTQGDSIVENNCKSVTGQKWVHYLDGYQNPASGLCLDAPHNKPMTQLILDNCSDMTQLGESWTPSHWPGPFADTSDVSCNIGNKGDRVACYARRQWAAWQSGSSIHEALLSDYTIGNTNEEWCADFVSYVYMEAGYPFTYGERDNWDQYTAGDIQYMGFTLHPAGSYLPKPGDVAYFNYPGGHVEIVVSGGQHPTFIYGDAGTIDPTIGNGDMTENSFMSDGSAGQVLYYLSPN
jgi:hypothetical protein